jgi:type IV secretion system protein VirB3
MPDDVYLAEDPLFLALTRPTLWLGVPVEATLVVGFASVLILMVFGNPIWALAIGGALLGAARLIVRADYNMFQILFLYGRTKAPAPNKALWGGSSYSPLPASGPKRRGFAHVED